VVMAATAAAVMILLVTDSCHLYEISCGKILCAFEHLTILGIFNKLWKSDALLSSIL